MQEMLEFLAKFEDGGTEDQICAHFPKLKKVELAAILNNMLQAGQIEVRNEGGRILYKAVENKISSYEGMVLALLSQSGPKGMWLRDIKIKTNIPHNLILKLLRNLESSRKIKTVKSIKNNRRTYMLYDITPAEDVTGGVWFSNNDVDAMLVTKLMEVVYKFCRRKEEPYALQRLEALPKVSDVKEFIDDSGICEVELTMTDLLSLVNCLVCDGRMEMYPLEDGIALRSISSEWHAPHN